MQSSKRALKTSLEKRLPLLPDETRLRPGSQSPTVAMRQDYLLKHGFLIPARKERLKGNARPGPTTLCCGNSTGSVIVLGCITRRSATRPWIPSIRGRVETITHRIQHRMTSTA